MLSRLKLELRQKQLYKDLDPTKPIIPRPKADGTVEYIPGLVPFSSWRDFSEQVEDINKFKLSWTASTENNDQGDAPGGNEFGSNYSKGVTAELRFFGIAFEFIYNWLMVEPYQVLNAIEARVTDYDCANSYRIFEIKLENTRYNPEKEPCIVSMRLSEADGTYHSFQKTKIEDDWQGWFNEKGTSTKEHPCFMYVVEKKPKFILTVLAALAYLAGILSAGAILLFDEGKEWIRKMLGICYFAPAPLIRTYIENVCDKYGFTYDTIFDDLPGNPYRNVCMFWPSSDSYEVFDGYNSPETKFLTENRTTLPVPKFLDQLKKVFNCEWYVTPQKKLVFKPRAFFDNQAPLADLTTGIFKIIDLEYTFNAKKKPATGQYEYRVDPSDGCTNEIIWRYNDDVDFDGEAENPMLDGIITKTFEFGMTAFNRDGTTTPFLEDAIKIGRIVGYTAALIGLTEIFGLSNFLTVVAVVAAITAGYLIINNFINDFFKDSTLDGVIRVANNQINVPRLVMWDGVSPMNCARVAYIQDPQINSYYNVNNVGYYDEHPTKGKRKLFGTEIKNVYNYPLYVDANYKENLYDRFHEYDNPLHNNTINQTWNGSIKMCCEALSLFGVWNGQAAKIGAVLIIENRNGRIIRGRLETIDLDYETGSIGIGGRVIK